MNLAPELPQRVSALEAEVAQLRRRLQSLEARPSAEASAPLEPPAIVESPPVPSIPVVVPPVAPPVAKAPTPVSPPPLPTGPSAIHEILGTLKLLPPKGGENGEAQIGGWWATRIGALLAVIGVVFFGIYVSANTAPAIKWLELAMIAAGVTFGGNWLERRKLRIGPVIIGAGHALIFFTAFAAYAVAPVKVIDSAWGAALLQAAAVGFIGWSGWRRKSATTATMAVTLGYVSAGFSVYGDFHFMAAVAGVSLAGAAVLFRLSKGWWAPVFVSVVLTPFLNTAVAISDQISYLPDLNAFAIYGLVLAGFAVHLAGAARDMIRATGAVETKQRRLQSINTSLSILAGLIATGYLQVPFAHYFCGAGLVLLAVTIWATRMVPQDRLIGMWGVKAASLLALAAIAHFDARTRWVVLAVEALILLAAAHRANRNSLRFAALGVWFLSFLFFAGGIGGLHRDILSTDGLAAGLYILAGVAFFEGLHRQWLKSTGGSSALAWILDIAAAAPLAIFLGNVFNTAWAPVTALLWTVGLGALSLKFRARSIIPAAGTAFLFAHASVQLFDGTQWGTVWLWIGAAPLGLLSIAAGWWLGQPRSATDETNSFNASALAFLLTLLGVTAWIGALMQSLALEPALAAAVGLGVLVAALGLRHPRPEMTVAGMISGVFALVLFWVHGGSHGPSPDALWWMRIAAGGVPAWWILGSRRPDANQAGIAPANALLALLSLPLVWFALGDQFTPFGLGLILTLVGIAFSVIAARCHVLPAYAAASGLALFGLYRIIDGEFWIHVDGVALSLAGTVILILAVAVQPLVGLRKSPQPSDHVGRLWLVAHALAAAATITLLALNRQAPWVDYGTVMWALGGIALFGLGIAGRARIHRLTGLVLLVLCIPRVFIYDIEEAKHRIAAFIVLGLLLLWVGFSYQKFRHLIEGTTPATKDER